MAFWLNAYNALVLKTVVDHYPIPQRSSEYPARSIRQIPGAFERTAHRVAGRTVTLDQIEQTILAGVPRSARVSSRSAAARSAAAGCAARRTAAADSRSS